MKKKDKLKQVGITTDGNPVVCGKTIFKYVDTFGIPLELILERFCDMVVDWHGFCSSAIKSGWGIKRLTRMIDESIVSVYGKGYTDLFNIEFEKYIDNI